ncbi:MAG: TonB-dependent receptor [Pseudomonadota bacterium]
MKTRMMFASGMLAGLVSSGVLAADEQNADEGRALEEIIVIGTKQGLSVQDTVTSVSVYDETRIDREVVFELDDIFLRSANVSSPGYTAGVAIRGIARNGVGFSGAGNTSNIYVNGAPISDQATGGIESLWDVSQVEILRGPQSTVQGRNSLAGAIAIQTKRPEYEMDGKIRVRGGELGTRQYSAAFGGGLIDGILAGRIAVDRQEYDGEVEYATTGDDSHETDGTTLRASLLFEPIDTLSMLLIAERIDTFKRDEAVASSPGILGSAAQIEFNPFDGVGHQIPQELDYEVDRFILDTTFDINERFSLVFIGTYEDSATDRVFGNPFDLTQFPTANNALFDQVTDTTSGEIRLEYSGDRLSGRVGVYYFEEETSNEVTATIGLGAIVPTDPPDSVADIIAVFAQESENKAFFTEWRYEPNDNWAFEAGVRFDDEENLNPGITGQVVVRPATCAIAAFIPGIGGAPCAALLPAPGGDGIVPASFDAWLPRLAVTYRFDEYRSLSLAVQRGYRAGGSYLFRAPGAPASEPPTLRDFDPEFITNYEIALRSEWLDQKVLVNANIYYSEWEDQQVTIPGPTGVNDSETVNVGESELKGVELEVQWFVDDNLEVFGTFGYSDTEIIDFPYAVDDTGTPLNARFANLSGNEFQLSPGTTASIGLYYEAGNGWFGDVTSSYTGDGYSDIFNLRADEFDSFITTNLRVGYENERYRAFIYANNIFDDRAVTEANFSNINADGTRTDFGPNPFMRINDPRVVGFQLEVSL